MPINGGRIGQNAGGVVVHHQAAASGFDRDAAACGSLHLDAHYGNDADQAKDLSDVLQRRCDLATLRITCIIQLRSTTMLNYGHAP